MSTAVQEENLSSASLSRRQMLKTGGLAAVAFAAFGCSDRSGEPDPETAEARQVREMLPAVSLTGEKLSYESLQKLLEDSSRTMKVIEEVIRHPVAGYKDERVGRLRSDALYAPQNAALLSNAKTIMEATTEALRQALRDPAFKEQRWHLHPAFVKAFLITQLLENHELIRAKQNAYRSSIDGTINFSYEYRAAVKISLDQLKSMDG